VSEPLTPAMFALLLALTEGERHGYGLMSDVSRLTAGAITLGPGTLYRTLQRLRVDGLVEEAAADPAAARADRRAERQRRYRITPAGHAAVQNEAQRLAALLASDAAQRLVNTRRARSAGPGE
jgi:DNA-binding PadR family transcriptional regulator